MKIEKIPSMTKEMLAGYYQCKKCGSTFIGKDIKVVKNNILDFIMTMLPIVSYDGHFFYCPICNQVHLTGFEVIIVENKLTRTE